MDTIRITESRLKHLIKKCVNGMFLNESNEVFCEENDVYDHHNPEYSEDTLSDYLAWKNDAYQDERFDNAVDEAIKETFKKHKGNNILGYENADETIPNGVNLGIVSINESAENNIELSFEIGYNYHLDSKGVTDIVLFEILCKDKSNGFSDVIASYSCKTPEDFNKDKYFVNVYTSNFSDNSEEIISELGSGKQNDFAYEDEPEKVFKRSICDIKPFVMEHLQEGLNNFKKDTYHPEWQKKRVCAFLENCGVLNETINERTAGEEGMTDDEVKAIRTKKGGYKPGYEEYEDYVDYGGGNFRKTFRRELSPETMRQKAHKASRGKGKPTPSSDGYTYHKHYGDGFGTNDYDQYVHNFLAKKFNAIKSDYDELVVPVENKWNQEAYAIRDFFKKYGYGADESKRIRDEVKFWNDENRKKYNPDMDYIFFTKGQEKSFHEYDDPGPHGYGLDNPYGVYKPHKIGEKPKIGTSAFGK